MDNHESTKVCFKIVGMMGVKPSKTHMEVIQNLSSVAYDTCFDLSKTYALANATMYWKLVGKQLLDMKLCTLFKG